MSDVMLLGVLRIPPTMWGDDAIDVAQRYSRYLEATDRIESDEYTIAAIAKRSDKKNDEPSDAYDPLSFTNPVNTVLLTSILSNSNDCPSSSSSDSSSCSD